MRLTKFAEELGHLTVLCQLSTVKTDLNPIQQELADTFPLPPQAFGASDRGLRSNLVSGFGAIPYLHQKRRIIVVGPELLILEVIREIGFDHEILVAVDSFLPHETVKRISVNIPTELTARVVQVPEIPAGIRPMDTVMVAVGFDGGGGLVLVPQSTRNILQFYNPFYFGEVIRLDPLGFPVLSRAQGLGWVTLKRDEFFTQHINPANERREVDESQSGQDTDDNRFAPQN
jgi:hypothetical protein